MGGGGGINGESYYYELQYQVEVIHVQKQNLVLPLLSLYVALFQHHPPPVLFLFKYLLYTSTYLATLSERNIETDDLPLEYHLLLPIQLRIDRLCGCG